MSSFMSSVQARAYANENNLSVYVPTQREITLDIDTDEQYKTFLSQYEILCNCFQHRFTFVVRESKSHKPGHHHIILNWDGNPDLGVAERIALQACLGSDPKRELSSLIRYLEYDPEPIILFKDGDLCP